MTCVVGIEKTYRSGRGVLIGADSAGSNGQIITRRADSKLVRTGDYVIGFTTSYRMGQLLQYELDVAAPPKTIAALDRHMATVFVAAVRKCLKDGGYSKIENNVETSGTFMVGVRGRLYTIESDYQVAREQQGYAAIGSGYAVALGALHASRWLDDADVRAKGALRAAADLTPHVRAPFHTMWTWA